jgi:hypothetical protein
MKIWVDDVRPAPEGYVWCKSNGETMTQIMRVEDSGADTIELLDLDRDAGFFAQYGSGDYIKILDWLEATGRNYPIRIHSQNVVGRMNMEAICRRNGWTMVK